MSKIKHMTQIMYTKFNIYLQKPCKYENLFIVKKSGRTRTNLSIAMKETFWLTFQLVINLLVVKIQMKCKFGHETLYKYWIREFVPFINLILADSLVQQVSCSNVYRSYLFTPLRSKIYYVVFNNWKTNGN